MTGGEFAFVERLRRLLPTAPAGQVWAGDDAAVLDHGDLLATDILVEGIHFDLAWCGPADVGWKALAVNLSDVAAMGGTPRAVVAAVVVPPGRPGLADGVAAGLAEGAAVWGCPLVGGDTSSGPVLAVSVAVLAVSPPGGAVLRSGARAGDTVFMTGEIGAAVGALDALRAGRTPGEDAARRLHRPIPRLAEGAAAAAAGATAMIDVSDGLAADLGHLCDESRLGVRLDGRRVRVASGVALERALAAGDDYELCFTASGTVEKGFEDRGLAPPVAVGTVTAGRERVVVLPDGRAAPFAGGWEHPVP